MITVQIIFGLLCALLIQKSAHAIYDPQNDGVKSRGFHRDQRISEPIVMHHQYSQVASNRPLDSDDKSREGRTSYTNDAENYVAQHGSNCPPNATGQFPYLLNCRQFLNCWKGRGYIQSCAPGTVFNPDTRECDNPQKVICLNYRGDANPNSQFAKIQSGETTVQGRVPNFANTPSATTSVQCSPESNGLEPHPFECEKFLNCANGITYIQVCGPGTVFNPISLVCDFAYNVECGNRRIGKAQRNESSSSTSEVDSGTQHHHGAGWRSPSSQGPDSTGPYYNRHNHNHTSSWGSSNSQPREPGWGNPNSQGTNATQPYYNRHAHNQTSGWGSSNGQQTEPGWNNHNSQGADSTQPYYNRHAHNHTSGWGSSNGQQTQPGWSHPNIQGTDSTRPYYNHHTHNRTADWGSSNSQQTEPGWSNPNIQGTDSTRPYYNHHTRNHTSGWGSSNSQQTNHNSQQEGSTRPYYNQHTHNQSVDWGGSNNQQGWRNPNSPGDTNSTWRNSNNQQADQARPYFHHHHHESHDHRSVHGPPPAYTPQHNEPWLQSSYNSMQHSNPNRPTSGNPNPPPTNQWNPIPSDSSQIDSTWQEPSSLPLNPSPPPSRRLYHVQEANVNQMTQSAAGSTVDSGPSKTTTTIYYAQPVDNYDDLTDYDYGEQVQQKQIPLDLTPPDLHKNHSWTTINHNLTPSSSNNPNIVYSINNNSNLYGGLLPPRAPTQSTPRVTYSSIHDHLVPPPLEPASPTRSEFLVPVPYGDLLPPLPDAKTTAKPNPPVLYPPPPSPTKSLQLNETKVYRVYPVYPPVRENKSLPGFNATPEIYYSPPYSGVSHDKFKPDFTDQTVTDEEPSRDLIPVYNPEQGEGFSNFNPSPVIPLPTEVHTKPKEDSTRPAPVYTRTEQGNPYPAAGNLPDTKSKPQPEFSEEPFRKVIPIYSRPDPITPSLVSPAIKTSTNLPRPYNREYYKPSQAQNSQSQSDHDETSTMPISEALKALFRPYYNRSGSVTDDVVQKMDQHIMKLTKPKPLPTTTEPQINFAGEEHSLSEGAVHETNSSDESGESVTERPNRHQHHFHHHHHNHQNHHHHHLPEHHSREFHRKHPNIRNPFATNDLEESEQPSEAIDVRFDKVPRNPRKDQNPSLDNSSPTCQFDCNNGNCIKDFLVCDGVNDCGNRFDEENCERIGYEVRLSSEEGKSHMGRVEVKVNGKWGYVCDDKFGMRAADVLCRELGFKLGASEVRANSYYPPNVQMIDNNGIPPFVMDEVDCLGNETSIRECNFKGWGVHDCSAEEVVGVVCKIPVMKCPPDYWLCKTSEECIAIGFLCDSVPDCADKSDESDEICDDSVQYRLAGSNGNEMEGRAEVKYRGTWGSICDDDFNKKEAQVFCRALGFLGEATVIKNAYGAGTGAIWLDQVSCFGNETSLDQCTHFAWGEHNCHHSEDVSVRCSERAADYETISATTTTDLPVQVPSEDIDLFLYKTPEVQRSSKAVNHNKRCGQINEHIVDEFENSEQMARVVNGTKALRGHHPWQASIRAKGHNGKSSHWCGAILITQMHILTAAHCLIGFPKGAYFIRIGDHYSQIAESSEVDVFIQNWYIHEDFRKGHHMNNDIAIIVLKSPVVFNDYIQPICLPPKDAKYDEGMSCTISGWGSIQSGISTPSNNLKAAHVPIISQAVCKEPYVYGDAITDGMFCAGYLDEGVDACDGDSGGPLACSTPNGESLYGIISWGQHCGQANKPGVYVKITHYLDWIMEKILFSIKAKDE